MPLYGTQLIDLTSNAVNRFYVSWRKAIRYLFFLPWRTHSILLPSICQDSSVDFQLIKRFFKFYKSIAHNKNSLIAKCHKLILNGSGSAISNNLTLLNEKLDVNRFNVMHCNLSALKAPLFRTDDLCQGLAIRELHDMYINCTLSVFPPRVKYIKDWNTLVGLLY